jgi:putative transposase
MQDQDKPLSHPSQRRYPPELRERATRLVLEAKASGERYGVVSRVARQLGIEPETLRHWAAKAEVDEGLRPGVPTRRRRGSLSSSGRTGSCGERTRYCRQQRLSSGRRSTADKRGSQLHRRPQRPGDRRSPLGVEPICTALHFAPSVYYAYKSRPPSCRSVEDAELKLLITEIWEGNFCCYGAEKIWRQLQRDGVSAGCDRVARLMRELGISGALRGKPKRTTVPAPEQERPKDLVRRGFRAPAPNRLWVSDITYVRTAAGFAYVCFVIDAFARVIVGWAVSSSLRADLALAALEMGIFSRRGQDLSSLVHHSDRGVQFLSVRYTERLAQEQAVISVGSKGDPYDNALAEAVNGLYKAELVHNFGPWRDVAHLERATAAWAAWWANKRLCSYCGWVPPAEAEAAFWAAQVSTEEKAA